MSIAYFNKPCGVYNTDPDLCCKFCSEYGCEIGIIDCENEDPYSLRESELEEFEIMEMHQELDEEDKELIASKKHKCYLHVTDNELIDAIQFYRKFMKNSFNGDDY